MKFFGVLFVIVGIILLGLSFYAAAMAYRIAYIPDPPSPIEPGTPLVVAVGPAYSSLGSDAALYAFLFTVIMGVLHIATGMLFYTVGEINEKIDRLLAHARE